MSETPRPSDQPRRDNAGGSLRRYPVRSGGSGRRRAVRLGVVLAVGAAIASVVWLAIRLSDSGSGPVAGPAVPEAATAVPITASGLRTLGGTFDRPIYWAGARPNLQYELTQASGGRIWIRYLPKAAEIGEKEIPYLTVGTYPVTDAFAVTSEVAQREGSTRVEVGDDAVAFHAEESPTNVYLAFKGSGYQIEVFDPDAGVAKELVASRKITLIPGS